MEGARELNEQTFSLTSFCFSKNKSDFKSSLRTVEILITLKGKGTALMTGTTTIGI